MQVQLLSTLLCPKCGHSKLEEMPTQACQFFYECENCKTVLKPNKGDCCVFCSFGSISCPPIQKNKNCGDSCS
ncbi:MAG: GDCCVxC domain-containing (seleno)protein [Cellulophaga sp.]